jgi:hypothetical protein
MRTILRYPLLDLTYRQTIHVPTGFKVRHVAPGRVSDVAIDVWAEVDTTNQPVPVNVWIIGTGHEFPPAGAVYVGTAVMPSDFVWHVFVGAAT